jgi:hypothetical protein
MNVYKGGVPFLETQCRTGDASVDGHALSGISAEIDLFLRDREIVFDDSCVNRYYTKKEHKDKTFNDYAFWKVKHLRSPLWLIGCCANWWSNY